MSEKQSETAANPETDQVDGDQVRPHPEVPSDGDDPDLKSRETGDRSSESRQVQPSPAPETGASDSHSDARRSVGEPSDVNKRRDRAPNPENSGVPGRRSVGEGPLPDVRRERDPIGDVRGGKTAYFVVHDNPASVDVHCESGGVISERNLETSGQSTTHEKDPSRPSAIKGRVGGGNEGLATPSSSDPEQGYSSDSLLLPDARNKKGRSHVQQPVAKGRRSTVWYVPHPAAPHGRDIFEAGGEESQNPKLKRPLLGGVVHEGGDGIERLPSESPSVEGSVAIETTAVATSVATSRSWSDSLQEAVCLLLVACLCCLFRPLASQFAKAPLFYALSAIVAFFALVVFYPREGDTDIWVSLLATVAACVALSVVVPRGAWAKRGDKLEGGVSFFSGCPSGLCSECCGLLEDAPHPSRRHSKYYHPLEEEVHTAFEHEVADVSNIDPKDCPQMRMVEEEILKSESPDSPPDIGQLNVDIHAPGSPRNSEEVKETVPRAAKKLAKTRAKSKSKSSSPPPKDWKAEEVPIPPTGGKPEDLSNADLIRDINAASEISGALKGTLKSLVAETTAVYTDKEFVCEHDGQGVACSCFADRPKQID